MSVVVGVLLVIDLPDELPASLNDWTSPPAPTETKKRRKVRR